MNGWIILIDIGFDNKFASTLIEKGILDAAITVFYGNEEEKTQV